MLGTSCAAAGVRVHARLQPVSRQYITQLLSVMSSGAYPWQSIRPGWSSLLLVHPGLLVYVHALQ